jgi:hypothetical protein
MWPELFLGTCSKAVQCRAGKHTNGSFGEFVCMHFSNRTILTATHLPTTLPSTTQSRQVIPTVLLQFTLPAESASLRTYKHSGDWP